MANADVFPLPGPSTRKRGKPVNSKQQNIIFNVVSYFVKEKENGGKPLYKSHAIVSKTAAATGFSSTYITKLAKEGKAGRTPGKIHHQKKGKFGKLDDFDLGVIRQIIHCFYLRNESPTIAKILAELKRKMDFPYKKSYLHSLLMKLGFKFKRRRMDRIIYERDDLISLREKYLREIAKVRETEPQREIVYMGETWLNERHRLQ